MLPHSRLRTFSLLALLTVLAVAGCGGAAGRYASHLQRARAYYDAGKIDKAAIELRNALQVKPRSPEALALYGRIAEQRGDLRAALGSYSAALDLDAHDDETRARLARMMVLAGAAKEALSTVEPGLRERPDDAALLIDRAAALFRLGKPDEARRDGERALQLAPESEEGRSLVAGIYQAAGDHGRALSILEEGVRRRPASRELHQVLASVHLAAGETGAAAGELAQVIRIAPTELAPRAALAELHQRGGAPREAEAVMREAVRELPDNTQAKLLLADLLSQQGAPESGVQALQEFLVRGPGNADLRLGLAEMQLRARQDEGATASWREVIRREGTKAAGLTARDRLAALQLARGRTAAAEPLIGEVLAANPRDGQALQLRAAIALGRNDPSAAIADLRAVLRDSPHAPGVQRTLARAYLSKGQRPLAEEALRAAVDDAPGDLAPRLELAELMVGSGRAAAAVELIKAAVPTAPKDLRLHEELLRVELANADVTAARAEADTLKQLAPGEVAGWYGSGLVARAAAQPDLAASELQHALKIAPTNIRVLAALTELDLSRHRAGPALTRLQEASAAKPRNLDLLNLLAQTQAESGDLTAAAATLGRALSSDPRSWSTWRNLARVRSARKDEAGAEQAYRSALELAPTEPQLTLELAGWYQARGRIDDAIARYEQLLARRPLDSTVITNNLAMLLSTYRSDSKSLERARQLAVTLADSQEPAILDTVGWVRFRSGEYASALGILERAATAAPQLKVVHYHLAMAERQLGQKERARRDLELALEGSPSYDGVEEARAALASLTPARG